MQVIQKDAWPLQFLQVLSLVSKYAVYEQVWSSDSVHVTANGLLPEHKEQLSPSR